MREGIKQRRNSKWVCVEYWWIHSNMKLSLFLICESQSRGLIFICKVIRKQLL